MRTVLCVLAAGMTLPAIPAFADSPCPGGKSFQTAGLVTPNQVLLGCTAFITGNLNICLGDSTTLTANVGAIYTWSTGDTTQAITVTPTVTTLYSVTVDDGAGCFAVANVTVTVDTPPTTVTITGPDSICAGGNAVLTASGGLNYLWTPGGDTTAVITVSPLSTTTYQVITANSCGSDTDTHLLTVLPAPSGNITGNLSICNGDSTVLTASGGAGYIWSTGDTTASITVWPTADSTFWVLVGNGVCYDSVAALVDVTDLPVAAITGSDSLCAGGSVVLTASGGGSYSWTPGGQTTSSVTVSPASTTTYTVTITNSCGSDTAQHPVTVVPLPSVSISGPAAICTGDSAVLTASGGSSYVWSPGGETTASISVSPATTTTYIVTATAGGCSSSDTLVLTVASSLFTGVNVSLCPGDSIFAGGSWQKGAGVYVDSLTASGGCDSVVQTTVSLYGGLSVTASPDTIISLGGSAQLYVTTGPGYSYSWTPPATLDCPTCPAPLATPESTTLYIVTVTDANGCRDVDSVLVVVVTACDENLVFVTTGFTPDNDGRNDQAKVLSNVLNRVNVFRIYNRWGQMLYEDMDFVPDGATRGVWDGRFKGKVQEMDVYVYYLTAECFAGEEVFKKGDITLVR